MFEYLPQNQVREAHTLRDGGEEPGSRAADVIACQPDRRDDGGGDDDGGGETVLEPLLGLPSVRPLHLTHGIQCRRRRGESIQQPIALLWMWRVIAVTDYTIEPSGLVIQHSSERSTQRTPPPHPDVGARLVFRTKSDARRFVAAGEHEGFVFEGKQYLTD